VAAVVFVWTTDRGILAKLAATVVVVASVPLMRVASWQVHFLAPFFIQAAVGIWTLIHIEYN
jgi:hypothetical protein